MPVSLLCRISMEHFLEDNSFIFFERRIPQWQTELIDAFFLVVFFSGRHGASIHHLVLRTGWNIHLWLHARRLSQLRT